jgi:hypothetical protein
MTDKSFEHKLVTIYLCDGWDDGVEEDQQVKEHLTEYLERGWYIKDIKTLSGSGGGRTEYLGGWLAVVLERWK